MQGMADLTAIQRGIAQQYSEDKNHQAGMPGHCLRNSLKVGTPPDPVTGGCGSAYFDRLH